MSMKAVALVMTLSLPMLLDAPSAAQVDKGWWCTGTTRIIMMAGPGASDGHDPEDLLAFEVDGWMAGSYHSVDEWGELAGFYMYDFRARLVPCQTKTWMLYIWGVPGRATRDFRVSWRGTSDPLIQSRLEFVQKPAGVVGGPELGTVWTTPPSNFILPLYTTDDGLTGYGFVFTLTMIPEPSSLLALAAGIGGLGVGLMRRRRRQT